MAMSRPLSGEEVIPVAEYLMSHPQRRLIKKVLRKRNMTIDDLQERSVESIDWVVVVVIDCRHGRHVTPLLRTLHWLPVEARIYYKTMVLAYGAVRGTAPPYLQALIRPYTQTRALRSSTSGLLAPLPLRKHSSRSAQSKLFAALAPQWWNKRLHDARTAESLTTFRRHLKLYLFKEYLE
ncbi:hypothetical protein J4Q44_G00336830 [Coregonus suidteri]|uniref:Uncharacterized protein n=1 Tax=Coregonus suidteri TaxID=861788 RepID=A0AAN8Q949_9TELE